MVKEEGSFLMSPLHHHYQKKGYHEAKIVTRFWIVTVLLCVVKYCNIENEIKHYRET